MMGIAVEEVVCFFQFKGLGKIRWRCFNHCVMDRECLTKAGYICVLDSIPKSPHCFINRTYSEADRFPVIHAKKCLMRTGWLQSVAWLIVWRHAWIVVHAVKSWFNPIPYMPPWYSRNIADWSGKISIDSHSDTHNRCWYGVCCPLLQISRTRVSCRSSRWQWGQTTSVPLGGAGSASSTPTCVWAMGMVAPAT